MKRARSSGGFSAVELLVVSLILGAWAGLLSAAYGARRGVADFTACGETRQNLAGAMEAYNLGHNAHRADLRELLPLLVREGYLAHLPADPGVSGNSGWTHFAFDGRDVVCTFHRELPPEPLDGVQLHALLLPLVGLVWATYRFATGLRAERVIRVRVDVPLIDPLSGPIASGPGATPHRVTVDPVTPQCHFCHSPIAGEVPRELEGRRFHAECEEFYRDKLNR